MLNPCIKSIGPPHAKIAFVGEAPGAEEETLGIPFVGSAGRLLDDCLLQAGIARSECFLTNVLFTRPPNNRLEAFCVGKSAPGALTKMPPLLKGSYLRDDFYPELERLWSELRSVRPNLIVTLGNTANWAIIRQTSISKIRGTAVASPFGKVLPTYHPAAIFRQWDLRPILVADLLKAKAECEFPEVTRPHREIIINPTLAEIEAFIPLAQEAPALAIDIETKNGQITCIGFAVSKSLALVIPFVDNRQIERSYWPQPLQELRAWEFVQQLLFLPCPKIFQNGLYDLQYLRRRKLFVRNALHDTMLLHHAMHPELQKSLGFMGSIYTNEPAWKIMRQRGEEVLKRDE